MRGLGEEDPVALLPYLGYQAGLAGLVGGEGEVSRLDAPGDVRGSGHLAAGEPVRCVADVADLTPTGPGRRHVDQAGADRLAVVKRITKVVEVGDLEVLKHPRRSPAGRSELPGRAGPPAVGAELLAERPQRRADQHEVLEQE